MKTANWYPMPAVRVGVRWDWSFSHEWLCGSKWEVLWRSESKSSKWELWEQNVLQVMAVVAVWDGSHRPSYQHKAGEINQWPWTSEGTIGQ